MRQTSKYFEQECIAAIYIIIAWDTVVDVLFIGLRSICLVSLISKCLVYRNREQMRHPGDFPLRLTTIYDSTVAHTIHIPLFWLNPAPIAKANSMQR